MISKKIHSVVGLLSPWGSPGYESRIGVRRVSDSYSDRDSAWIFWDFCGCPNFCAQQKTESFRDSVLW